MLVSCSGCDFELDGRQVGVDSKFTRLSLKCLIDFHFNVQRASIPMCDGLPLDFTIGLVLVLVLIF